MRALLVAMANDLAYVVQAVVSAENLSIQVQSSHRNTGTQLCLENYGLPSSCQRAYLLHRASSITEYDPQVSIR